MKSPLFGELVRAVKQGEEIVLTDHGQAVAKIIPLMPIENTEMAKPGIWKGLPGRLRMSADFDEPLEDF
jgi:prevent-host-death family protein